MDNYLDIFKNRKKIAEGLKNKLFKKEHVETQANIRYAICTTCPEIDYAGNNCFVPYTEPCCSKCGCSLSLKTRSLSSECPLGKWKALVDNLTEDKILKQINHENTN